MRNIIAAIIPVLLASAIVQAQDSTVYEKKARQLVDKSSGGNGINPQVISFYCSELKRSYIGERGGQEESGIVSQGIRFNELVRNANREQDQQVTKNVQEVINTHERIAKQEQLIYNSAMYAVKVANKPVDALIPVFGSIYMDGVEKVIELGEAELKETQRKKLAYSLKKLEQTNVSRYNEVIASGDLAAVSAALKDVNYFVRNDFEIDKDNADLLLNAKLKFLSSAVNEGLQRLVNEVDVTNVRVEEIDKKLYGLASFTYQFAKETNNRLRDLGTQQNEIKDQLNSFYNEYKKDQKALNFMQGFLFEKMNPKEKIAALQGGFFPGMKPQQRRMLEQEIELERKKEKVIKTVESVLSNSKAALTILDNLGIGENSNFVRSLKEGVAIGEQAFSAFQAFSSGNYLQGIATVTGIFGKKGGDVAGQRHQQIMKALQRISGQLDAIDQKLDTILKNQYTVIDLQVQTLNAVLEISEKIDVNHAEVLKRLTAIEQKLYENRELIINQVESECQDCLRIIRDLQLNVDNNHLPAYEDIANFFTNYLPIVERCEAYLLKFKFFDQQGTINPIFKARTYVNNLEAARRVYLPDTLNAHMLEILESIGDSIYALGSYEQKAISLYFPQFHQDQLMQKVLLQNVSSSSDNHITRLPRLKDYLACEAVERLGRIIRNYSFVVNLTDGRRRLIDLNNFLKAPSSRNWLTELEDVLKLTNMAIAQQNLLSGDLLLPYFVKETTAIVNGKKDSTRFNQLRYLLSKNELFAKNFLNLYIKSVFDSSGVQLSEYSYAFSSKQTYLMNMLIRHPFMIRYFAAGDKMLTAGPFVRDEGWYCQVDNTLIPLPEPISLVKPEILHSNFLHGLLDSRDKLSAIISSYKLYDQLNKPLRRSLNYYILKSF